MNKILGIVVALAALVSLTGCAHNIVKGHESSRVGIFFGDVGIDGSNNVLTIQNRSRVTKLSILGSGNRIMVEDDVTLPHIEFCGRDNEVSVPGQLMYRVTEVGANNRVIRRQIIWELPRTAETAHAGTAPAPPPAPTRPPHTGAAATPPAPSPQPPDEDAPNPPDVPEP